MKQYVLCFAHPLAHQWWPEVLLIEKLKPAWQLGKYNLPGGSVEDDETFHQAAARELQEETGIMCEEKNVKLLGTIEGNNFVVYVCRCGFDSLHGANVAESLTNEAVFWMPLAEALNHEKLIDNLRLVIPFCRAELTGWNINEQNGTYLVGTRNAEA